MENTEITNTENTENKKVLKPKKRLLFAGIAIVVTIIAGIFIYHESHYQSTEDAYVESHLVKIAPRVSGQIVKVMIDDNQKVKEGDIVAIIDDADYKVKLAQAEANYQKALKNQKVAVANKNAVDSEIDTARKDLERYKNLYAKGAVSKQVLDNAQTKYDTIQARLTNAEEAIMSKSGEGNKVADADIKVLKAMRDKAALDLSYTVIKAPRTGTVTNKNVEKGAYVQVGQPLFALASDEVWIVANFKESQIGDMKPGQPVSIKIDTYPKKKFKGKVDSIQRASGAKSSLFPPENAVGSFVKIVQRIPVKIVFDEDIDGQKYTIVSGMSVIPKVKVK